MPKVVVNYESAGPDAEFEVPHLGLFKNGEEREVTDEQVRAFEANGGVFPSNGVLRLPDYNTEASESYDAEARQEWVKAAGAAETIERMEAANSESLEKSQIGKPRTAKGKATQVVTPQEGGEQA